MFTIIRISEYIHTAYWTIYYVSISSMQLYIYAGGMIYIRIHLRGTLRSAAALRRAECWRTPSASSPSMIWPTCCFLMETSSPALLVAPTLSTSACRLPRVSSVQNCTARIRNCTESRGHTTRTECLMADSRTFRKSVSKTYKNVQYGTRYGVLSPTGALVPIRKLFCDLQRSVIR